MAEKKVTRKAKPARREKPGKDVVSGRKQKPGSDDSPAASDEQRQEITSQVVDEKAAKAKQEELLSKIIEWKAEGFDVKYASELLKNDSPNIFSEFERIDRNVEEIRKIKNIVVDVHGVEEEANALIDALNRPENLDEIRKRQKVLGDRIKLRALGESLDTLNAEGMEADVVKIRELLKDVAKVDDAEKEIKTLKAKIRERFFLGLIKKEAKPAPEPKKEVMVKLAGAAPAEKSTMFVEDIFLLYRDTRFISHHTRTVRAENDRPAVFRMLKAIRDFIRKSGKYQGGMLFKEPSGSGFMLVYGSGNLIVGMSVTGTEPSWTEAVIARVFSLAEEKFRGTIEDWDGDVKSLDGINQFMKVLLLTFAKLEPKIG